MYRTARTGEIGEPCGVPTSDLKGLEVRPLNFSFTVQSAKKAWVHKTSLCAKPRSAMICVSHSLLTLSKKPWMLKRSRPVHRPAAWAV